MSIKPRTPEHFPKMKHRARKRQHRNHVHWCVPQHRLGDVHVSIVPVTLTFDSQIKRAIETVRRIALGLGDVGPAADRAAIALEEIAPNLPKGASSSGFLMDEAFRGEVHTVHRLSSLPASPPTDLPTAVLNPNVRKQR